MWWTLQRWSAQPVFQPKSEETRRRQGSGVITFMRPSTASSGALAGILVGRVDRPMLGLGGVPRCQLTLERHG